MNTEQETGWIPLTESMIPDYFNTEYQGNFAQNLEVNQPRLKRFLEIASLDGRVLLTDKPPIRHRDTPNMNSDGSLSLQIDPLANFRFGTARTISKAAILQPEYLGWRLSIDGDTITERLRAKRGGAVRGIEMEFAKSFNRHFTHGLEVVLIRDKLSKDKDPYITGKILGSILMLLAYASVTERLMGDPNPSAVASLTRYLNYFFLGITWMTRALEYSSPTFSIFDRKNAQKFGTDYSTAGLPGRDIWRKFFDTRRHILKSKLEIFALPLELDRVLLAEGYLYSQKLRRNPLIRLAC